MATDMRTVEKLEELSLENGPTENGEGKDEDIANDETPNTTKKKKKKKKKKKGLGYRNIIFKAHVLVFEISSAIYDFHGK